MRRFISSDPVQTEFLHVRLLDNQKRQVAAAARAKGISVSEFARRALAMASEQAA